MNKLTKFSRAILAIAIMLCVALPTFAHDFEVGGIYYNYLDETAKTVTVSYKGSYSDSYSNEYTGSVTIPSSVTYSGTTYSVTRISSYAFRDCRGLTSITIPNSVTSIGNYAFDNCTNLAELIIEDGKETLSLGYNYYSSASGQGLFYDCPLEKLYLGRNLSYDSSHECGYSPFYYKTKLKEVTIGNSVTSIGNYAFYNCTGLTSVTIGNSVTSIGSSAFDGCIGLTSITIPNSVTSIGTSAFYNTAWYNNQADGVIYINNVLYKYKGTMPEGTSISIKDGTVSISPSAFSGCTGLTGVTIPNSVTTIGSSAFYGCTGLTSATIPNSVTSIGNYAFDNCTNLAELIIEDGKETLSLGYNYYSSASGQGLFYDCPLEKLYLGRNLSYDSSHECGYSPFYYKTKLKEVTIGNSVTSIGGSAFSGCTSLTSVTIPNSVTSIGNYAFHGCTSLAELIIEDGKETLSLGYNYYSSSGVEGLFYDCPLEKLYLGRNLSYETDSEHGYSPFYYKTKLKKVTIANSVTEIGSSAFRYCTGLTEVTIGNSVTSIGEDAFYKCTGLTEVNISDLSAWCKIAFGSATANPLCYAKKLNLNGIEVKELVIPDDITEINNYAFYGFTGLTSVTIGNSATSIGERAFDNCTGLTSVTIPNSVTSIGSYAFDNCTGLKSVTIPNSVTTV